MFKVRLRRTAFKRQAHESDMGTGQVYTDKWSKDYFELRKLSEEEQLELDKAIANGTTPKVKGTLIEDEKEAVKEAKKQFGRKGEGMDWLLDNGLVKIEFNNQTGEVKHHKGVDIQPALC